jgi:hypothetical protein
VTTSTHGKIETRGSEELDRCRNSGAGLEVHLKVNLHTAEVDLDGGIDQKLVRNLDGDITGNGSLRQGKAECDFLLDTGESWRGNTRFQKQVSSRIQLTKQLPGQILPLVQNLVHVVLRQVENAGKRGPSVEAAGANILGDRAGL